MAGVRKAPDALLKLGYTQYAQKQYPAAKATLTEVTRSTRAPTRRNLRPTACTASRNSAVEGSAHAPAAPNHT